MFDDQEKIIANWVEHEFIKISELLFQTGA
jgi:hypothetical protein